MFKKIFLFMPVVLIFGCTGQTETNDLNKLGLIGDIQSISEESFEVEYKYGEPIPGEPVFSLNFDTPCLSRTVKFDKKGNIQEIISKPSKDYVITQNCRRDRSGNLLEEIAVINGCLITHREYEQGNIKLMNLANDVLHSRHSNYLYTHLLKGGNIPNKYYDDGTRYSFKDSTAIIIDSNNKLDYVFIYGDDGGVIMENTLFWSFTPESQILITKVEKTDEEGRVILEGYNKEKSKNRYEYDANGNIVTKIIYGEDGAEEFRTKYEYDERNNLIKVIEDDSTTNYGYDENDNICSMYYYHHDYSIRSRYEYEHNEKGQFVKSMVPNTWGDKYDHVVSLERDNNNRLTRAITFYSPDHFLNADKTIRYVPNQSFDIKGVHDTDFSVYDKVETDCDKKGNWTKKICYMDNIPIVVYTRKIKYSR